VTPAYNRSAYRALLETALAAGYAFRAFDDPELDALPRVCLLRHDVDADPGAALELARVEAGLGVHATYFFTLRSPLYNVAGRANVRLVREILGLGHWLGLHFDVAFDPGGARTREDWIEVERRCLADLFETKVAAVSFHQPGAVADAGSIRPRGLVSAFDLPGFAYHSDANKADAIGELPALLRSGAEPRIQLLVHPLWWTSDDGSETTEALWERAILANLERSQEQLVQSERAYGPARRFRIERP
jgi:hypothetical protein